MRTWWTTKGNRDAGSSCSCDRGLHRYLRNFGGGVWTPPQYATANSCFSPIPVASQSKAWLRGCSLAGVWVWVLPQAWMSASCECRVFTGRGLCVGLFIHPQESDHMQCVCVWSWSLDNDEALAHKGRADKPMAHMPKMACCIHCCSSFLNLFCLTSSSKLWRISVNIYVYIYLSYCAETVYELQLLPNKIVSEIFLHKSGVVHSVDWIFIKQMPACQWLVK